MFDLFVDVGISAMVMFLILSSIFVLTSFNCSRALLNTKNLSLLQLIFNFLEIYDKLD